MPLSHHAAAEDVIDLRVADRADDALGLLHVLAAIASEGRDVDDVLDQALESLSGHLGLPAAAAHLVDDHGLRSDWTWRRHDARLAGGRGAGALVRRTIERGAVVWVEDVVADPTSHGGLADDAGARGWVGIPIGAGGRVVGVVELASDAVLPFDGRLATALGDVGVILGLALDRLDRRRALDEAEMAFVARAAHELRGPVATIGVAATTLVARRDRLSVELQAELADRLEGAVERLRRLVDRLVQVAELETGLAELRPTPVDVVAVTRDVVERLGLSEISIEAEVPVPTAMADPQAIDAILTTLVLAASRHGNRPADVRVRRRGPWAEVDVVGDVGPGLGVTAAGRLATCCGGDVTLEEDDAGRGRYRVRLPATP